MKQTLNLSNKYIHKDINIESYIDLMKLLNDNEYATVKYNEIEMYDKYIIIRHDVDIDLNYAYKMALIEHQHSCKSTFFIMLHNPLYNTLTKDCILILKKILELGHSIGLHFDPTFYDIKTENELINKVKYEVNTFSYFLNNKVNYISFHQPLPEYLNKDYFIKDIFESVYNSKYFTDIRYISDSMGQWREESIIDLIRKNKTRKIQFLSHPALWFNSNKLILKNRLKAVISSQIANKEDELRKSINNYKKGLVLYE